MALTLDQLTRYFTPADRAALREAGMHDGVDGLVVYRVANRNTAVAYGRACEDADYSAVIRRMGTQHGAHWAKARPA